MKEEGRELTQLPNNTKTLLVMRHAKSSWKHENLTDFDRPLNGRGKRAAPFMARILADKGIIPQLIISSAAERARQTTKLLLSNWSQKPECQIDAELYLAAPRQYLHALGEYASDQQCVMLVGHNPGLEFLVEKLSGADELMPTAAVAIIQIDSSWGEIKRGHLTEILRPRELE